VNVGALPETLLESELFGHEKGAFTGAAERRLGRVELADGGTIFLDEIGEEPSSARGKTPPVLEEREVLRGGGTQPRKVGGCAWWRRRISRCARRWTRGSSGPICSIDSACCRCICRRCASGRRTSRSSFVASSRNTRPNTTGRFMACRRRRCSCSPTTRGPGT